MKLELLYASPVLTGLPPLWFASKLFDARYNLGNFKEIIKVVIVDILSFFLSTFCLSKSVK